MFFQEPPGAFDGHALTMNQLPKRDFFSKNPISRAELKVDVFVAAFYRYLTNTVGKIQTWTGYKLDLCDVGKMLYQLSYQPSWEIVIEEVHDNPWRWESMYNVRESEFIHVIMIMSSLCSTPPFRYKWLSHIFWNILELARHAGVESRMWDIELLNARPLPVITKPGCLLRENIKFYNHGELKTWN